MSRAIAAPISFGSFSIAPNEANAGLFGSAQVYEAHMAPVA